MSMYAAIPCCCVAEGCWYLAAKCPTCKVGETGNGPPFVAIACGSIDPLVHPVFRWADTCYSIVPPFTQFPTPPANDIATVGAKYVTCEECCNPDCFAYCAVGPQVISANWSGSFSGPCNPPFTLQCQPTTFNCPGASMPLYCTGGWLNTLGCQAPNIPPGTTCCAWGMALSQKLCLPGCVHTAQCCPCVGSSCSQFYGTWPTIGVKCGGQLGPYFWEASVVCTTGNSAKFHKLNDETGPFGTYMLTSSESTAPYTFNAGGFSVS